MSDDSTVTREVQSGVEAELVPLAEVTVYHSSGGAVTSESLKVTLDPRFNGQARTAWTNVSNGIAQFYNLADGRYDILTDATTNHSPGFKGNVNFTPLNPDDDVTAPCLHS